MRQTRRPVSRLLGGGRCAAPEERPSLPALQRPRRNRVAVRCRREVPKLPEAIHLVVGSCQTAEVHVQMQARRKIPGGVPNKGSPATSDVRYRVLMSALQRRAQGTVLQVA